jgi:ABC-2 type transport system ATP-binding protein
MRLLLGMLRADSGTVSIEGRDIRVVGAETWSRVGHLVAQPFAYPELDVRSNLTVAALLHGLPAARVANTIDRAVSELQLKPYAAVRARVLSQGNRQRVGLACALQHEPELIILDEPTTGLDPRGVILLRESLRRRARAGAAILVSSHHLDEVARIANRITVINRGRVIGALDPRGIDIERAFFALVEHDELTDGR